MKRRWLIALTGVALALAAYGAVYWTGTSCCRTLGQGTPSGLAWLKQEFHLSDADFQRIEQLHNAYLPACAERCRQIDAKDVEVRSLLAKAGAVTPEVERAMAEAATLRGQCQTAMLKHFVEVSRAMPSAEGRRYLEWVCAQTLGSAHEAMAAGAATGAAHEHSGH